MVEFLKTLAIACIPAIITGIVTYIVARKNAASQISIIKEQNKHDLEKLMEQHKVDKAQAVVQCVLDMFQKVCPFAVFESIVAFLREFLPVNKATVIFFKSRRHHIGKQLCLRSVDILIHFCLALFLKIAFAGSKPNEHRFRVRLYVLVHKVSEDDGFSTSSRTFQDNISDGLVHRLEQ